MNKILEEIYKENFKGVSLTDTSIINAIELGYKAAQKEQYEKQLKLAGTMREFFSSITHSSKKYDDLLKELYK